MMRNILFRGKLTDGCQWRVGFFAHHEDDFKGRTSYRIYSRYAETDCDEWYPDRWEVDPKTVGQWTGLLDKNGEKIFEGDIVESGGTRFTVKFGVCGGTKNVGHAVGYIGFYADPHEKIGLRDDILYWANSDKGLTVIGNIYDNPELLNGKEDNDA